MLGEAVTMRRWRTKSLSRRWSSASSFSSSDFRATAREFHLIFWPHHDDFLKSALCQIIHSKKRRKQEARDGVTMSELITFILGLRFFLWFSFNLPLVLLNKSCFCTATQITGGKFGVSLCARHNGEITSTCPWGMMPPWHARTQRAYICSLHWKIAFVTILSSMQITVKAKASILPLHLNFGYLLRNSSMRKARSKTH